MTTREFDTARAWVEVDLGALISNYESLRQRAAPRLGVLPVVKADAYGLGVAAVVEAMETVEPWGYAVAALSEGIELRELGIERRILLLFCTPQEMDSAVEAGLAPAVGDAEALARWRSIARRAGRRLPFHLEVDTGMGRGGFRFDDADGWLPTVLEAAEDELEWEGTFQHFHSSDDDDPEPSRRQWERLQQFRAALSDRGGVFHVSASAGAARWAEYSADLIRPGISLFGGDVVPGVWSPRPVVAVRARVTTVREVPAGWTVSYGATYRTQRAARLATLAIGYGDGVRRELSNRGLVMFGDRSAPIVGRVCMDVTVADVTELPAVAAGDVATVIGGPHQGATGLSTVADRCGTIPYEILTGLTRRLPRCYPGAVPERDPQRAPLDE